MNVERLLTEIRDLIQDDVGGRGLRTVPGDNLITACPDDFAAACRSIAATPRAGVAVLTGFFIAAADPPCGETDGPLGAVFLARAFAALGVRVVLMTDPFCRAALTVGLAAAGIETPVVTIPPAAHPWDVWLQLDMTELIAQLGLTHIIALERVGPAVDDRCYTMLARDITTFMNPGHQLIEDAARREPRLTTIGIGDGGNEIGMGKIPRSVIARNIPRGEVVACRVPCDHLIVAGVSNWGAYALAAGVALLTGRPLPEELFDLAREFSILSAMVEHGPLVDGVTTLRTPTVDGLTFDRYSAALARIGELLPRIQP